MIDPMLGVIEPDPIAEVLGTGYQRFASPFGIEGLAKMTPTRLDILAVVATIEHMGHFRHFIEQCKLRFDTICIWEVWNEDLAPTLIRYGFKPFEQTEPDGEHLTGFKWEKS